MEPSLGWPRRVNRVIWSTIPAARQKGDRHMGKTTAPLLSFSARGSLAKTVTYSSWKGISYARQHVIPANPNTTAQQETRNTFRWVHDAYKYIDALVQAPWILYAKGQKFTAPNAWMTANLSPLRGQANLANIVFAKSVNGGPAPGALTLTAGSGQITVAMAAPALASGWSIVKFIGIAMKDVNPSGEMETVISKAGSANATPWQTVITGLTAGQVYRCGGFFELLRPDGLNAYTGDLTGTATPT